MKELNENLEYIGNMIENIDTDPTNFYGQTIGDELHDIAYQLSRIADSLEKIANK